MTVTGSTTIAAGSKTIDKDLTLAGTTTAANAFLSGLGVLTNQGSWTVTDGSITNVIVNEGSITAEGSNAITGSFTSSVGSTLTVEAGLVGDAGLTISNGFTNAGTIVLDDLTIHNATLTVSSGTLTNTGTIKTQDTDQGGGGTGTRSIQAELDNQGTVTIDTAADINKASAAHLNSGLIDVNDDLIVAQSGTTPTFTSSGTIDIAAGKTLTVSAGTLTNDVNGTIKGGGTLDVSGATFVSDGTLSPSASAGTLSIIGSFAQGDDAVDDFLISADYANSSAGESYVVFGGSDLGSAASVDLSDLDGTNGLVVNGIDADDQSGRSLGAAGDVNGDGIDDIIIGAPFSDPGGVSGAGESYVLFGATGGFSASFDLSDLDGSNGFVINGVAADDFAGSAVNGAGDINGDGIDDIIVGATGADLYAVNERGKSYVIFGDVSIGATGTVELSSLNDTNGVVVNGDSADHYSGYSVSSAGDINGDGIDDFVIGAPLAEPGSPPQPAGGESYVIFGAPNIGASNPINISTLNSANGFRLNGTDSNDSSGRIVSAAGDVNGDGIADLLIAARFADGVGNNVPDSGESYVVFGASDVGSGNLDLSSLNGANGFVINGVAAGDSAGGGLGGGGDVNGDGFDDIVIGAPYAMDGDSATGVSYVIFGGSNVGSVVNFDLSSLDGSNGLILPGVSESDFSGTSVNIVGDVNGDGFGDILIGANGVDPITNNEGASYLVFGGDFSGAVTHQGTTGDDILNGTAGADVMIGGLGVDVLVGSGGGDVMRGGAGDDVLVISDVLFARIDGGTGDDILRLAGSGTTLDLTSTGNLKIFRCRDHRSHWLRRQCADA